VTSSLVGKVALIAGGAGGIGPVFGKALAAQGAAVVLADLDEAGALKAAAAIAADGADVRGAHLDVTDLLSARSAVEETVSAFGGIDIMVNCAGLMAEIPYAPLASFPLDWWNRVLNVNVTGTLICAQAVVPAMAERGGGRIVNMASAGAFQPSGVYGISKYAVTGLTKNLASQLGSQAITVNAIAPGLVDDEAGMRALPAGPIREAIRSQVPLKAHAQEPPEELVGTLLLLTSDAGRWITGQTISVDGGWVLRF
jgi:NAD(P)-dependent dehydrogenase (short-subunit alcohol dehydrogenase family)